MSDTGQEVANGMPVDEDDDFFGDQSSDALEKESRLREVEVLRRQHMTSGIREGASAAHDEHLQQGFDEGFADGAKASAEAAFLMGACSVLGAFYSRGNGSTRAVPRSQALGDTEVPSQDIRDIQLAGAQLQADLRNLPEGGSVSVGSAKEACTKVAVFEIPSSVVAATDPAAESGSSG